MSTQTGYLDSNGHPRLTIQVSGTSPDTFADVDALIDTGFTGFLMLPIAQALPLGLVLVGTGDYELADNSTVTNFLARGTVTIRPPSMGADEASATVPPTSETVDGIIVLGGNGALLGMEFIRILEKVLVVGPIVTLFDMAWLARIAAEADAGNQPQ